MAAKQNTPNSDITETTTEQTEEKQPKNQLNPNQRLKIRLLRERILEAKCYGNGKENRSLYN